MRSAAERAASLGAREAGNGAPLVQALRLAAGAGCWPRVELVFHGACGTSGRTEAACLFRVLLQGLALGARRPLRLGFAGQRGVTHDERALLQLIEAAGQGDAALVEAGVAWLVRPAAATTVTRAAAGLAALLARHPGQRPSPARIVSSES